MTFPDPIAAHGTPEWFAARRGKITASMAPAILCPGQPGVHGNPLTAYLELTREETEQDEDEDDEEVHEDEDDEGEISLGDAAEYGKDTQEVHAKMLAKKSGVEWAVLEPGFFLSDRIPYLGASPDALGSLAGEPISGEFKAPTNLAIVRELRHGIPMPYVVQSIVQMVVLGIQQSIVSVLYPPAPTWQRIYLSPELEAWVLEALERFMQDHVEPRIPPAIDAAWLDKRAMAAVNELYAPRPGLAISFDLGDEGCDVAAALEEAKAAAKQAKEQVNFAKARLIELSDGAERIWLPDGSSYTRKTSQRSYPAREAKVIPVTTLLRKKAGAR